MLRNYRVIHNKAGTLIDLSAEITNPRSAESFIEYTAGDYIYLASELPFNHRYFEMLEANDQAADLTVELWTGNAWREAVDLRDETKDAAGIPLAESGIISWAQDERKNSWAADDTDQMNASGLEALRIYGLWWVRLSWSANLLTEMSVKYIGHKFCTENDLRSYYPDLARATLKDAWETGKTTWEEQILAASEDIVQELIKRNVMHTPDQLMDWRIFEKACIHRTAEIIFSAFGQDYEVQLTKAIRDYKIALDVRAHRVDKDQNAKATGVERKSTTEFMTR